MTALPPSPICVRCTALPERETESLRLDKWLWHARFFKTRTLSSRIAQRGRIRVNRMPVDKAHHAVRVGDVLTIPLPRGVTVVRVLALGERRGPATEAAMLYETL